MSLTVYVVLPLLGLASVLLMLRAFELHRTVNLLIETNDQQKAFNAEVLKINDITHKRLTKLEESS